jgi:alpha-D-xyloside xylohydrolase
LIEFEPSLTENAVRINFYKETEGTLPELILTSNVPTPEIEVSDSPSKLEIKLKSIDVNLDKQTGKLSFADHSGKILLSE